jgi:FtsP/CotA-like multicopper oxidase with cupredoxin domain
MQSRSPFWLAAAALLIAAVALPVALVAAVRAGDGSSSSASGTSMGGMNMSGDSTMSGHMAAAPTEGVPNATATRGGTRLAHTVQNGVWVFKLEARPVLWEIMPGTRVTAWTYNGLVPGPQIRVPYGQRVRIEVKNSLPEATTAHWHGIAVPNAMDGVPDITQEPIEPGGTFTYEFDAIPAGRDSKGGTFFYHSHFDEDRQVGLGLSGTFVIEAPSGPRYDVERAIAINEWNLDPSSGATRPPMEMEGMLPNYFTLNGKSFPATETIEVKRNQRVLLRLVGAGQFTHPMHLHGTDFEVVAKDGHPLDAPYKADVLQVAPGERYDIAFTATEPGKWAFHCHIGHHLTNNGADPGGLLLVVDVT